MPNYRIHHFSNNGFSDLFPVGFVRDTESTLHLLLRPNEVKSAKRNRRLAKKARADLELGVGDEASFDLKSYPFWGDRLAEVQRRYDAARPHGIRQWWYYRHNKPEWATLWIAIVVFVLTVFFGMISSVTGIMQTYAAFHVRPSSVEQGSSMHFSS